MSPGVRCIHCGKVTDVSDVDHWQVCEKHPARVVVVDLDTELARCRLNRYADENQYKKRIAELQDLLTVAVQSNKSLTEQLTESQQRIASLTATLPRVWMDDTGLMYNVDHEDTDPAADARPTADGEVD